MEITQFDSDNAVLSEIGTRLERIRLSKNVSQVQLAENSGVSRATVERVERGEAVNFKSVLRILRSLGMIEALGEVIVEPRLGPFDAFRQQGHQRVRATGGRTRRDMGAPAALPPWPAKPSSTHPEQ